MWQEASYLRSVSVAALAAVPVFLGCALFGMTGASAATCSADPSGCDPYVVTIAPTGSNTVTATGMGEFDLSGLTPAPFPIGLHAPQIGPNTGVIIMVNTIPPPQAPTNNFCDNCALGTLSFPGQPSAFGTGSGVPAIGATSTGPAVAFRQIAGGVPSGLSVPAGYMSGMVLDPTTASFAGTLVSLGLSPGSTTTWTWGSEPDQSFTVDVVPLPATLPLLGTGLGALGLLGWRKKRRAVTVA